MVKIIIEYKNTIVEFDDVNENDAYAIERLLHSIEMEESCIVSKEVNK